MRDLTQLPVEERLSREAYADHSTEMTETVNKPFKDYIVSKGRQARNSIFTASGVAKWADEGEKIPQIRYLNSSTALRINSHI